MKVLAFSSYYTPEIASSLYLNEDIYKGIVDAGYKLELYVPMPTRGISKELRREYKHRKREEKYNGNMVVHRVSVYGEGKNSVFRALRYLIIHLLFIWKGLWTRADVIFVQSTPPTQGLMAGIIGRLKRIPVVYNLQDVFPDSLLTTGLTTKDSLLYKIGSRIERNTYKLCSKIIVISEDFKDNILHKGVPEDKIEVVYNWVDESSVYRVPRSENKIFDDYGLDRTKFYISYSGNIGLTQNMDFLVLAAERLRNDESIQFVIVGDGVYKSELERRINEKQLKNITLIPFQPYERIAEVFSIGDVGLIISKTGVGNNSVPSKTWSYMSASTPILASFDLDSELCKLVLSVGCGLCTKPDELDSFIDSIQQMRSSCIDKLGKRGRAYIEQNLSEDICTKKYIKTIESLKNNNTEVKK